MASHPYNSIISTTANASGTNYDYVFVNSNPNTYSWNSTNTVTVSSTTGQHTLNVAGDAKFEGDVIIKGKNIADSLERIEERLAILRPNEELEAKWENLRGLRNAYMELEAEIKEKEKIWGILKK